MYRGIKVRCYPNSKQKVIIDDTLRACNYIWNKYIEFNKLSYENGDGFITAFDFSVQFTQLKKSDSRFTWMRGINTNAIQRTIQDAQCAYNDFFSKRSRYPKFKSIKRKNLITSYFFCKARVKLFQNDISMRNIVQIPSLGKIRVTKKNRLPNQSLITGGRVIRTNDKYFLLFNYQYEKIEDLESLSPGIGIDLGIEKYATIADENGNIISFNHFMKNRRYIEIEDKILIIQSIISKKAEVNYQKLLKRYTDRHDGEEPSEGYKKILKNQSFNSSKIRKLVRRLNKLYKRRTNYATDKVCKMVNYLVITKPEYITVENLDIKGMLDNGRDTIIGKHTLHDRIAKSKWYEFKERLVSKCEEYRIELREANKYYASTRICSKCGTVNQFMELKHRNYICLDPECANVMNRDENAAINLCKLTANNYKVLVE